MPRLIHLLGFDDVRLRLTSLWAIKNMLRKTSLETKRDMLNTLGPSELSQ
jgi:hypothetical protein